MNLNIYIYIYGILASWQQKEKKKSYVTHSNVFGKPRGMAQVDMFQGKDV
jgi:hypothetical protein